MENIENNNFNLVELSQEDLMSINGGESGDLLYGLMYGMSWLAHKMSFSINELPPHMT